MTKYCPGCRAKLKDWFVFCEKCGIQIGDPPTPEYKPGYEPPEGPVYEDYAPPSDVIESNRNVPESKPTQPENIFNPS